MGSKSKHTYIRAETVSTQTGIGTGVLVVFGARQDAKIHCRILKRDFPFSKHCD